MLHLFILLFLAGLFIFYYWKKYSPYLSFKSVIWLNWRNLFVILRGKGPQNQSLSTFLVEVMKESCFKYLSEGMVVLWFPEPLLMIYGPEAVKFFANEPSLIDKPKFPYNLFDPLGKDGIFRSSGKRAKHQRKLLSPAFSPNMMKNYVTTMNDQALCLVQELRQLENHVTHNLGKIIKNRTLMLLLKAVLDIEADSTEENSRKDRFVKLLTNVIDVAGYRLQRPWFHYNFLFRISSAGRRYHKAVENLRIITRQISDELRESYILRHRSQKLNGTDTLNIDQSKSIGDALFKEHFKDPSFTLHDLETELVTIIVAGYDTASYSLIWTLWLLGLHPDVQEKAYEEVQTISGDVIEYDEIRNLTYVDCIVKESLRLYSPVPTFARLSSKDLYFENHKVPCGTTICFLNYILHRNPELYKEPESFNPDRFADGDSDIKPWHYIPFAESVRSCIGKNYAMLEMKVLLIHVLRNFKIISLTPREDAQESYDILLKCAVPLSVKFIPR